MVVTCKLVGATYYLANDLLSCGNDLVSHGNELSTCGNELLIQGTTSYPMII